MTSVDSTYLERWHSGQHVGASRPLQRIEIRKGRFFRGFSAWTFPEQDWRTADYAIIPSSAGHVTTPWQATWTPQSDWVTIPGLSQSTISKDTTANNGVGSAVVLIENVRWQPKTGRFGDIYHLVERGYLSPWRGYAPPGRSPIVTFTNEWYERLARNAEIRIWQGYGEDEMYPTFVGLIDEVDFGSGGTSGGDTVTITARSFGRTLTDQTLYGWNKDPTTSDPIVFADRLEQQNDPLQRGRNWILVDECSDVVRLILRWAGFKHWNIEDTGVRLTGTTTFTRSNFYIDVINEMCAATGFIFFVGDPEPSDDASLGTPVFRHPRALDDVADPQLVTDHDLLTDLQAKNSDEDRAYIIRVRGKIANLTAIPGSPPQISQGGVGVTDEGDVTLRPMYVYRPPWSRNNEEAGILKHLNYTNNALQTVDDCRVAAFWIAVQEALLSATCVGVVPGNTSIGLDEHVALMDQGTGLATRVYITNVKHEFVWGNDQAGGTSLIYKTTFAGSLLDTPDFVSIKKELSDANVAGTILAYAPALRTFNWG